MLATNPQSAPYVPPRPHSISAVAALFRASMRGDGDLLSLIPKAAYHTAIGPLGYSRRSTIIVNAPELTRQIMQDERGLFPKSDLMVNSLEPLVGNSVFTACGDTWRRQRKMIDPSFSHIHLARAFGFMQGAVDDCLQNLRQTAAQNGTISLDLTMSHLTADIITRTVFSCPLQTSMARDVFEAFAVFEKRLASVDLWRLIVAAPFSAIRQRPEVMEACRVIRQHLGTLLDTHLQLGASTYNDIAASVAAARNLDTDEGFSREEIIDQLGVMFLAGHETTASALIWAFYILGTRPELAGRLRAEIAHIVGSEEIGFHHIKFLIETRAFFKETLRLYPPITFIPRVALAPMRLGAQKIKRGAMIMISPWVIHRHHDLWHEPDRFDLERFLPDREKTIEPATYLPFGYGPRICVGAAFATTEAVLILARLLRDLDIVPQTPGAVYPIARLTTRPAAQIQCKVRLRK